MNLFVALRSVLLILAIYVGLILNNAFQQYFTNQVMLSTIVLCLVLTELLSYAYRLVFTNPPGQSFYLYCLCFCLFAILSFPVLLEYVILFSFIVLYLMGITFLSTYSTISDQLQAVLSVNGSTNPDFFLYEKKGLIFSHYFLEYRRPLSFVSLDDKRNFFDLLKNKKGFCMLSESYGATFTLSDRGLRFLPSTKRKLIRIGNDLEKMTLNFFTK